jgi:hypothetical protein
MRKDVISNSGKRKSVFVTNGGISWQTKAELGADLDRVNDLAREAAELDREDELIDIPQSSEWEQYIDSLSDDELFNRYVDDDNFLQEVHEDDPLLAR